MPLMMMQAVGRGVAGAAAVELINDVTLRRRQRRGLPGRCRRRPSTVQAEERGAQADAAEPFQVLIVGAGLTGSLTAALLRRRWQMKSSEDTCVRPLTISVWERAWYPAGRFGASASFPGCGRPADLGSQVLSVADPDNENTGGGHGISRADVRAAATEVDRLVAAGRVREVPPALRAAPPRGDVVEEEDGPLCPTEERMLWPGLWRHFWAPLGFRALLEAYLDEAGVSGGDGGHCEGPQRSSPSLSQPSGLEADGTRLDRTAGGRACAASACFGHRVERIQRLPGAPPRWRVTATARDPGRNVEQLREADFDCVILCVPAPDVLRVEGLRRELLVGDRAALEAIGYDSRRVCAIFLDTAGGSLETLGATPSGAGQEGALAPPAVTVAAEDVVVSPAESGDAFRALLAERFGEKAEVSVDVHPDCDVSEGVHMLAWQDVKRVPETGAVTPEQPLLRSHGVSCVVVHGSSGVSGYDARQTPGAFLERAQGVLAGFLGTSEEVVRARTLDAKVVDWEVAQMTRGLDSLERQLSGSRAAGEQKLRQPVMVGGEGRLLVAGDFFSIGNFLGAFASASAAASVVAELAVQTSSAATA